MWPRASREASEVPVVDRCLGSDQMTLRVKRPCLRECLHARITVRHLDLQLISWCRACTRPWLRVGPNRVDHRLPRLAQPALHGETTPGKAAK